MGYDKKYIAIAVAILAALVIFYAGTRYEKMRITSAEKKSAATNDSTTSKKGKKNTPATTEVAPNVTDQSAAESATPAPAKTAAPKTTTPAYPAK